MESNYTVKHIVNTLDPLDWGQCVGGGFRESGCIRVMKQVQVESNNDALAVKAITMC